MMGNEQIHIVSDMMMENEGFLLELVNKAKEEGSRCIINDVDFTDYTGKFVEKRNVPPVMKYPIRYTNKKKKKQKQ